MLTRGIIRDPKSYDLLCVSISLMTYILQTSGTTGTTAGPVQCGSTTSRRNAGVYPEVRFQGTLRRVQQRCSEIRTYGKQR